MEFSDMVLNFGLRYDMFDPNTIYPSDYRNPANDIIGVAQSDTLSAETKYQISPRFALSYQVGQAALLRFSYGHFFQMPPLYAMYSNSNWLISPNNYATILGNPNLEAEKTVNYELGFWQEINRDRMRIRFKEPDRRLRAAFMYLDEVNMIEIFSYCAGITKSVARS